MSVYYLPLGNIGGSRSPTGSHSCLPLDLLVLLFLILPLVPAQLNCLSSLSHWPLCWLFPQRSAQPSGQCPGFPLTRQLSFWRYPSLGLAAPPYLLQLLPLASSQVSPKVRSFYSRITCRTTLVLCLDLASSGLECHCTKTNTLASIPILVHSRFLGKSPS